MSSALVPNLVEVIFGPGANKIPPKLLFPFYLDA